MFEIIKMYPIIFVFTVILPLGGGVVGSYLGWDALKGRIENELHKSKVEESLSTIDESLKPLSDQINTIQRYESALSEYDQKDAVLVAVLEQYKNMHSALESFHTMQSDKSHLEKGELAGNILGVITSNLTPIKQAPQLPNQPLVIGLAMNKYKVIFAVPMRKAPDINFGVLPEGVSTEITEASKFGFTVEFKGSSESIDPFGFSASAEL